MSQLLAIERNFLRNNDSVREHLSLQEVESLLRTIKNGQKAKFVKSIALSSLVYQGFQWFKSDEGRAAFAEAGITWTAEDFFAKVYGWQKSFGYKMAKCGSIVIATPEKLEAFEEACDAVEREQETANRTIEGFLKFCNSGSATESGEGEGEGAEGGEGEGTPDVSRPQTVFTMSWKREGERGVAVRITADGALITRNEPEEIAAAIAFLQDAIVAVEN